MSAIFKPLFPVTLHSANRYPSSNAEAEFMGLAGRRNQEMRAMTISAFRVAQNSSSLTTTLMSEGLLLFLLADSRTTVNHWIKTGRLSRCNEGLRLELPGINECLSSLTGESGAYNTDEATVRLWVHRMLTGDDIAYRTRQFNEDCWPYQHGMRQLSTDS
jgi:hypothetical protein